MKVMYIMVFDFFPLQCLNQVDLLEGALICGLHSKENVVFFPIWPLWCGTFLCANRLQRLVQIDV